MWRSMFAGTNFSPCLAVRMTAFDHLACIGTIKMNIIFSSCISTKMRWINNFSLGRRRLSHASHSSLCWDSWISYLVSYDPKLVLQQSYFSSFPSFVGQSFLVQQNRGCHWTSHKRAAFAEKTCLIGFKVSLLLFILFKDPSSKKLPHCCCNWSMVYPHSLVSFAVCFCMCRPNDSSHWNCTVKLQMICGCFHC